ncbi:TPD1 protein homolog 1-like [Vitis riparia]|uniref:TPD1 protein-like 1 n=1 Tax=Vitis vinifera TaxID=29760 RepID=A0A438GAZ0_VITVI|nr:TPD1 protein homolog 1 [Vitis vinifera]XP_034686818.1 TPD1 protein homolog 1-like [Vitis riparia]RVW69374.1 TPD1 protein-like 1 [Vitis vinifera]|eukprot:XP_010649517.1 PREDICTED: TPD1 protein homolog 1 [Vitis vinifera]
MTSSQMFFFCLILLIIIVICSVGLHLDSSSMSLHSVHGDDNQNSTAAVIKPAQVYSNYRKLLLHGTCTNRDISISQSRDSSSGIPQYIVQIVNTCVSGCAPSDIHLHCGWFASARIVNPRIFKRLFYDDCLVNGGKPLKTSQIIRFTYSNSFMYPLAFKSAKFC